VSFNHFDGEGRAHMVDVTSKDVTDREARAEATISLGADLLAAVLDRDIVKGDVFGVARLAGISAVKKTSDLIPLAHPLAIHHAAVEFTPREKTGVEMEAMTGASVAALAVYDMCKGRDKSLAIGPVRLLYKSGGKSGTFIAEDEPTS